MSAQPIPISNEVNKIPENIWVRNGKLVAEYKPVNLGQGFPDFPEVVPQRLKAALITTQSPEAPVFNNQYARSQGHPRLVNEISELYSPLYNRKIDPLKEILVTVGGYESLHCAINAVVNPEDEVILIEPHFDSYKQTVKSIGAKVKYVTLRMKPGGTTSSDFVFDKDEMKNAFNEKTKAIVVNTPHNPLGKVFSREEIEFISDLCKQHNCLYISDEVYEWLLYEGREHVRAATLPGMWERTLTICSAGKTFNVTGWKTGWTIGPEYLVHAAMKIHSNIIYTCPTPLQIALADTFKQERLLLGTKDSYWYWLQETLLQKRNRMYSMAKEAGLNPIIPDGGYFMVADISKLKMTLPDDTAHMPHDQRVNEWLIKNKGFASIPVSVFYSADSGKEYDHYLRFCFIKGERTLDAAEEKMKSFKSLTSET